VTDVGVIICLEQGAYGPADAAAAKSASTAIGTVSIHRQAKQYHIVWPHHNSGASWWPAAGDEGVPVKWRSHVRCAARCAGEKASCAFTSALVLAS